jgi:two-component system, LytTR family, response regulator
MTRPDTSPAEGMRVVVVDDERPARDRILDLLTHEPDVVVAATAQDGNEAVSVILRESPDLLLLDVQMPGRDGFEVLEAIPAERVPLTIFVTAYDRYAIKAFEAHAIDYLLKPFSDQRFESAMAQVRKYLAAGRAADAKDRVTELAHAKTGPLERLVLRANGRVLFVDVADIDWVEAAGVYVYLHVGQKVHLYRSSVTQLLERLDPRVFVRIHRSAAVNVRRIRELRTRSHGDFTVVLKDGRELSMSRSYRPNLEGWLKHPL